MKNPTAALKLLVLLLALTSYASAETPRVADLAWMTGSWEGPIGPGTIEEHWSTPRAGTISALVRNVGGDRTIFTELILIEESEGTLLLHLQQRGAGFAARAEHHFTLDALSERRVRFVASDDGAIRSLTYARSQDDEFLIDIELEDRALPLRLRSLR